MNLLFENVGEYHVGSYAVRVWSEVALPHFERIQAAVRANDAPKGMADEIIRGSGANAVEVKVNGVGVVAYRDWP